MKIPLKRLFVNSDSNLFVEQPGGGPLGAVVCVLLQQVGLVLVYVLHELSDVVVVYVAVNAVSLRNPTKFISAQME